MTTQDLSLPSIGREQKITSRHHERVAIVYVRQSTIHQVQRHRESTQLQYGLVDLATRLGWPRERVLVIDDDLGLSGASAEGRTGFQRLLSEVALDHVGMILGVEMSRLARSCKDWYQLLELCALFSTLICDLDGLYDPSLYNDRLLLGLKGTMSEAELHIIGQRMLQGSQQKALRGELVSGSACSVHRPARGHRNRTRDFQAPADEFCPRHDRASLACMPLRPFPACGCGLLFWLRHACWRAAHKAVSCACDTTRIRSSLRDLP